ncbi:MAG TPA: tRNA (guanosine(37)-N1)-methyltransferase TrmD [bacterium]|nr:tRNA (guanosine(37)-N1)-methyltransferase TrmD [bacterium]
MKIDIITLFPKMFDGVLTESIIKRAVEKKILEVSLHNLRDYALDKHHTVDDTPYGGGAGMVLKVDVMDRCLSSIMAQYAICNMQYAINDKFQIPNSKFQTKHKGSISNSHDLSNKKSNNCKVVLMTPQGRTFDQGKARELAKIDHLILICGHYEGFDQRIREHLVDEEISIGDFVLTGGEIPAMAITDSVARLVPGVIKEESHLHETFSVKKDSKEKNTTDNYLYCEYPHYTKPAEYKNWKVPEILLSGNHGQIAKWRDDMIRKKGR